MASAFVACDFRRTNFFDAVFDGCKLVGSVFADCTLRPMRVSGGRWSSVTLRGANLAGLDLTDVDLGEADLSLANLTRHRADRRPTSPAWSCGRPT